MAPRRLKITLRRSPIGQPGKHEKVLRGLGLKKLHQTVVRQDTREIRGMVNKVIHMVDVEVMD
ncbi:MAG: 50S ribosomal protein L30 [Nitrospinota bacterium]